MCPLSRKEAGPAARSRFWDAYSLNKADITVKMQMIHVEILSMMNL